MDQQHGAPFLTISGRHRNQVYVDIERVRGGAVGRDAQQIEQIRLLQRKESLLIGLAIRRQKINRRQGQSV